MTREEAREFLMDISYKLGTMAVEYLSEKDSEKMRDAVETLEQEPIKGHWIEKPHVYGVVFCSKCGFELRIDNTNYCPNCGAKMAETEET